MRTKCLNCHHEIDIIAPLVRGGSGAMNDAWPCEGCEGMVCIYCYVEHSDDCDCNKKRKK